MTARIAKRQEARPRHLVQLPRVALLAQRGDRDVGDVVYVDDRFANIAGRQSDHTVQCGLPQIALAEVLRKPGRTHQGVFQAAVPHDVFAALGVVLAATGQQDQALYPCRGRCAGQGLDLLRCPREGQVGKIGDIRGMRARERGWPGVRVVPIERRRRMPRSTTHRVATLGELRGDAAPGLPAGPDDEYRLVLHVRDLTGG